MLESLCRLSGFTFTINNKLCEVDEVSPLCDMHQDGKKAALPCTGERIEGGWSVLWWC
jgi:hypothetical protein